MSHKPPSTARIALLLVGSVIAGTIVASLLVSEVERRREKPLPLTKKSLIVESPSKNASQ